MKKFYFFLLLVIVPLSLRAEDQFNLVINGASKHFDVNRAAFPDGLNEKNYGLGVEYNLDKLDAQKIEWVINTGFFKDSLNGTALYAGGAGLMNLYSYKTVNFKAGIEGSLFYSSAYNQGNPFVALLPIVNIGTNKYSVNITVIPRVPQFIDAGVIFVQLKIGI